MIIVKTKNGDHFINDKAVTRVEHDRVNAVVNVYGDKGVYYFIEAVEGIIYTSDAQPTSWKDEGSEIKRLMKSLEERTESLNRLRDAHLLMEAECDELRAQLAKLKPKEDPDRWWPDNVDSAPVVVILSHVGYESYDPGYEVRLGKIFESNNIKTVGDLLRIGRRNFRKYRSVGGGSISRIDNALEMLYDIKGW